MTQVAELLLEEGRKEGLILSGKIFRVVRECSDLTNERIAEEVGCSVEEVESTRKIFDIQLPVIRNAVGENLAVFFAVMI